MKNQKIFNRLRRIEGQVRGIEDMLAKDRPEQDILIQLSAVKSAVSSTISELVTSLLERGDDGRIVLTEQQLRMLLSEIKK